MLLEAGRQPGLRQRQTSRKEQVNAWSCRRAGLPAPHVLSWDDRWQEKAFGSGLSEHVAFPSDSCTAVPRRSLPSVWRLASELVACDVTAQVA